jgi:ferrous-iron efflux pump FieF
MSPAQERLDERASLTTRAALASVASALFLLVLKSYAALATGSVAMLGSLADTGLDQIASLVTLFGVRVAAMPADREHRFGHGKAEALAALAQVVLISISAIGIGWRAIDRLIRGDQTANAEYGIAVSLVAILVTLFLVAYQRSVVRRTGSVAIRTDNVHYQSDLYLNLSVIAALALDQYVGWSGADPLFGLGIAMWLMWGAWKASSQALDQLMDREWPEEKRMRFLAIASSRPEAKGIHDLRTRSSGAHDFAQFHIWIDPQMTVEAAHDIVEAIEGDLELEFPGCEVLIHLDPDGHVDNPGNALLETDETREPIPE